MIIIYDLYEHQTVLIRLYEKEEEAKNENVLARIYFLSDVVRFIYWRRHEGVENRIKKGIPIGK